jgi:hypothetical protein
MGLKFRCTRGAILTLSVPCLAVRGRLWGGRGAQGPLGMLTRKQQFRKLRVRRRRRAWRDDEREDEYGEERSPGGEESDGLESPSSAGTASPTYPSPTRSPTLKVSDACLL